MNNRYVTVSIPIGWLTVAVMVLSVVIFRRIRRFPRGHCQACGYNLTNNATGTCPECGTTCDPDPVKSNRAMQNP